MDAQQFDELIRSRFSGSSRRGLLAGLGSGVRTLLAPVAIGEDAAAKHEKRKRKKNKRKKTKRCKKVGRACTPEGRTCCAALRCGRCARTCGGRRTSVSS